MISRIRYSLACAILLLSSYPIHAQIPVTDAASIFEQTLQHVQTLLRWKEQYDQMRAQFTQLRTTHDALTGVRNLGDVFDNPALHQYLPDDWLNAYARMKREGYEGLVREGIAIYNATRVHDACAHLNVRDMRTACESRAVKAAQDQGDATASLEKTLQRGRQIRALQRQISQTRDPKSIAELQARLSVEQAAIANEATRISLIRAFTAAEERIQAQRQREFQARAWSATQGVQIQPLQFGR